MSLETPTTGPRARPSPAAPAAGFAVHAAVMLSWWAGLIHAVAIQEHLRVWWGYGAFFIGTALFQICYGVILLRWRPRWLLLAGFGANLLVIALYVVTRTAGIPWLGPHAGLQEQPAVLDMAATAAELALIVVLVVLLDRTWRARMVNTLLVLGALAWVLRLTGVLTWPAFYG